MTPWQLTLAFRAYIRRKEAQHDHDAFMMYHGAVLARVKRMPPFKNYLSASLKKPKKGIDERDIIGRLKAYQSQQKEKP